MDCRVEVTEVKLASPGVRFPPPLVFVTPFFLSFLLDRRLPFSIVGDGDGPAWMTTTGTVLLAAGFGLMLWAIVNFSRAKTNLLPFKSASTLVIVPPYTFTRNPMYLGLTLAYVGGALATNWAWPLVFLPAVVGVTAGYIIVREERYLRSAFGAQYEEYCRDVRRWL